MGHVTRCFLRRCEPWITDELHRMGGRSGTALWYLPLTMIAVDNDSYRSVDDEKVSRIMSKVMMRDVCLDDVNIKAINFESKKFTGYFASIYGEVDIDLNNCEEIFTAFSIIDKKMNKIHEILKQTA